MRKVVAYLLLLVSALTMSAQTDTSTRIFDPAFKTLKVQNPDNFYAPTAYRLGSNDRLLISFDEITTDRSYLRYRIIHCSADWTPSNVVDSEFLDGFNEASIDDYGYSSNTFVRYVNYHIEIPNEQINPLISGNYLLQVYDESDPDVVLLQARFSVVDPVLRISAEASTRTDRGFNDDWQQLSITLNPGNYRIRDPYNDLIVVVEQNMRTDNNVYVYHPQRVSGDDIVYEHVRELIFPVGNEYRRFETVRVDYPGMHVDSVRYMGSNYHHYLMVDEPRAYRSYLYDQTQNGRYKIDEFNATDAELGADYVTVNFTLKAPYVSDREIYLNGEFTHGLFLPQFRMNYDTDLQAYTLQVPLKQGSYNYQYLSVPKGGPMVGDYYPIEGNKYETRNEYVIKVYQREPGSRYDKLIGIEQIY